MTDAEELAAKVADELWKRVNEDGWLDPDDAARVAVVTIREAGRLLERPTT
jgi:hypothetical protein